MENSSVAQFLYFSSLFWGWDFGKGRMFKTGNSMAMNCEKTWYSDQLWWKCWNIIVWQVKLRKRSKIFYTLHVKIKRVNNLLAGNASKVMIFPFSNKGSTSISTINEITKKKKLCTRWILIPVSFINQH